MKKYYCLAILLILTAAVFCISCSDYVKNDDAYDLGQTVTPEMLESMKDNAESQKVKDSETLEIGRDTVFYWTKNGTKLHLYKDCRHLVRTAMENILTGSYYDANTQKLSGICSACLKESGAEFFDTSVFDTDISVSDTVESTTSPSTEIPNVLYWTVSGSKYHLYSTCRSLSESTNIKSGDITNALESEKREACSFCLEECGIEENELPWNTQSETTS